MADRSTFEALYALAKAVEAVDLGRSIHNSRNPEQRIEGPVWDDLRSALNEANDAIKEHSIIMEHQKETKMNDEDLTVMFSLTKKELEACKSYTDLMDLIEAYVGAASQTAIESALERYPHLAEAKNG